MYSILMYVLYSFVFEIELQTHVGSYYGVIGSPFQGWNLYEVSVHRTLASLINLY